MIIETQEEAQKMRHSGQILSNTLKELERVTRPGIACERINEIAAEMIGKEGATPSFLNYEGFPANLCISLNEEIVHGIPGTRIIQEGDLVSYDLGVNWEGFLTDAARSFICQDPDSLENASVEQTPPLKQKIIEVCQICLNLGIKAAKTGNRVGDIGAAVQQYAEENGFSVVRKLVGHGVGKEVHEPPRIPNYGKPGTGEKLKEGMCLAIEPMICEGSYEVDLARDRWTFVTADGKLSAHFEDTLIVRKNGGEIVTR